MGGQSATGIYLWRKNPELTKRRGEVGEGTQRWDKVCLTFFGLSYLGILVVSALDAGNGWSLTPLWTVFLGSGIYVVSAIWAAWAMSVNVHFEKTVRLQSDRDHRVIDTGPYRFVRHPGYLATIFGFVLTPPLMLRSWWALLPAVAAVVSLMVRTLLEDRFLHTELSGYREYAAGVRYRLFPSIW